MRNALFAFSLVFLSFNAAPPAISQTTSEFRSALASLSFGPQAHDVVGHNKDLFRRSFATACLSGPVDAEPFVAAATAGSELEILSQLVPCGPAAPQPPSALACTVEIVPQPLTDESCRCVDGLHDCPRFVPFKEVFQGSFAIPVPDQVGLYDLSLDCALEGEPLAAFHGSLYVTYGDPMNWMQPARKRWYERSACWAQGMTRAHSEEEVLLEIMSNIYDFGRARWRYGYTSPSDPPLEEGVPNDMVFPITAEENQIYTVRDATNLRASGSRFYTCSWFGLLQQDPAECGFADCYVFSETMQSMAGLQGVGGLEVVTIYGAVGEGYMTDLTAEAIDPRYPGNVVCEDGVACFPYYFGSHNMRGRDGIVYDTTFGVLYDNPNGGVGAQLTFWDYDENTGRIDKPGYLLREAPSQYGNWFYLSLEDDQSRTPLKELAGFPEKEDPAVRFDRADVYPPVKDGLAPWLTAEAYLDVEIPGKYTLAGALCTADADEDYRSGLCGSRIEDRISERPSFQISQKSNTTETLESGDRRMVLTFSGEEIHDRGIDGPWIVRLLLTDENGEPVVPVRSFDTAPFPADLFGEIPIVVAGADPLRPVDLDGDGVVDALSSNVDLKVRVGGARFAFETRTFDPATGETFAYSSTFSPPGESFVAQGFQPFRRGDQTIRLFTPLPSHGGSLQVSFSVFSEEERRDWGGFKWSYP